MKILEATTESFNELVDFLEQNGNPVLGRRWDTDKEGLHTYMTKPIDIKLIKSNFTCNDDVVINEQYSFVSTASEWMDIHHRPGLKYKPELDGSSGDFYFDGELKILKTYKL